MAVTIRNATLADLDTLTQLERIVFDPNKYPISSRRNFEHLLKYGKAVVLVAEDQNIIRGMAVLLFRKTSKFGRLYSIGVDPAYQGGEFGKALFSSAEYLVKEQGLIGMVLEIRADNVKHRDRYVSSGYKIIEKLQDYYPDGSSGLKLKKVFKNGC